MLNTSVLDTAAATNEGSPSQKNIRVSTGDGNRFERMFAGEISTRYACAVYDKLESDEDRLRFYKWLVVNKLFEPATLGTSIRTSVERIDHDFVGTCEQDRIRRLNYRYRAAHAVR